MGLSKYIRYWPVIVAIIALISSFVLMKNAVAENQNAVGENRVEHRQIFSRLDKMEVIVGMLPEMRQDIKTLLKGENNE